MSMGATDNVRSDQTHVPLRYLIAFVWPITATIRDFLAAGGHTPAEVDAEGAVARQRRVICRVSGGNAIARLAVWRCGRQSTHPCDTPRSTGACQ